ncbi:MAG: FG-GAP repeat domain-containing protein [Paracoccaceae bacterium]
MAPRQHLSFWIYVARGALLALAVMVPSVGPVAACVMLSQAGSAVVVAGSFVKDGGASAWYADLTQRYGHGVLGDALEPTTLTLSVPRKEADGTHRCVSTSLTLQRPHVFEDIAPRLVDLTGDGQAEIVTVRSHERKGAQIAVYQQIFDRLQILVTTPYIGRRNRWLAPVAIADLDGDGNIEIAYVDRPHLAKTLRIWRYKAEKLREIATLAGVSNHRIGEDFISGGARNCGQGLEMVVANAAWTSIFSVSFDGQELVATSLNRPTDPDSFAKVLSCN